MLPGAVYPQANPAVTELLQKLCSDLFTEKPVDCLEYIGQWVEKEKAQREMAHNTRPQ